MNNKKIRVQEKKEYFIGITLPDEISRVLTLVAKQVETNFNVLSMYENTNPYISLKLPFKATRQEVNGLERVISQFVELCFSPLTLSFSGLEAIDEKILYACFDAGHKESVISLQKSFRKKLAILEWMNFSNGESIPGSVIVNKKGTENFDKIFKYVKDSIDPETHPEIEPQVKANMEAAIGLKTPFIIDSVTLFVKEGGIWGVKKVFLIPVSGHIDLVHPPEDLQFLWKNKANNSELIKH